MMMDKQNDNTIMVTSHNTNLKNNSVEGNGVLPVTLDPETETPLHIVQQPQLCILPRDEGLVGSLTLEGTRESHRHPLTPAGRSVITN